ncbi:MAG: hypothetical protein ACI8WT_003607 [Clostridium sp.]|jgi:hypothetical protein
MIRKKIIYAALVIAAFSTISTFKTYAADAAMPSGTVVIGVKAYDLGYANDIKNQDEINSAVVNGGKIYVKGFDGSWVDNDSAKTVSSSLLPKVTYKNATGIESAFAAGDLADVASLPLEVVSIE